jgi:hypothetical protein
MRSGAAAGLVHDHHHLISQEFVGDSRNGFLEVDEHTRSVSSSVTKAPGGNVLPFVSLARLSDFCTDS